MSEYTKGKWTANEFGQVYASNPGKQDQKIAYIEHSRTTNGEANAQLIAAAPDLLKACEGLMEKADNGSADFDDPMPGSIYLKAKAALAKAKPKPPAST